MTEYDETYDCSVVFAPEELTNTLGEVVARAGMTQLRIAETEKISACLVFLQRRSGTGE